MRALDKKELKQHRKQTRRERTQDIVLLLEDIQYARNVANMFRTADAAGVSEVLITGISHRPPFGKDLRKASRHKEKSVNWKYIDTSGKAIQTLKKQGYWICAIELTDESFPISKLPVMIKGKGKVCFVAGNEVHGVPQKTLERCDAAVHIPMYGVGASLNVSHAIAVTLFSF